MSIIYWLNLTHSLLYNIEYCIFKDLFYQFWFYTFLCSTFLMVQITNKLNSTDRLFIILLLIETLRTTTT